MLLVALALWLGSGVIVFVVLGSAVLVRDQAARRKATARPAEPAPEQATPPPNGADQPTRAGEPATQGR